MRALRVVLLPSVAILVAACGPIFIVAAGAGAGAAATGGGGGGGGGSGGGPLPVGTATGVPPFTIRKVSGDAQNWSNGQVLPDAFVVAVTDVRGLPVPNAYVEFQALTGSPGTGSTRTDEIGRASMIWILGGVGPQSLRVHNRDPLTAPVTFTGTAVAPPTSDSLSVVRGTAQSGPAGGALPAAVVVGVIDGSGRPVAGVSIYATVTAGGGVSPTRGVTDANGELPFTWTLGPRARDLNYFIASSDTIRRSIWVSTFSF